jgi:hypothetical protein
MVTASRMLQVGEVTRAIKEAALRSGENPERYGSHSLRSGGASALFNAGLDSLAVRQFGCWKSDAVMRYARIDERLTSRLAVLMTR